MEDVGVEGKIILKRYFNAIRWDGVDWIHVVQDRDKCQDLVTTVKTFRIL